MPTDHEVLRWLYERRPTPNPPPDDDLGDPADFEPIYLATLEEVAEHADSDHDRLSALFLLGEYSGYDPVQNRLVELTAATKSDRVILIAFRLITRALGGIGKLVRGGGGGSGGRGASSPAPRLPGVSPPTPRLPRAPRPRLPALPWPRLPIPRRRRAKKQPQPAASTPLSTPAADSFSSPPISAGDPFPSPPTPAADPFPSPRISAADPFPSPRISAADSFSSPPIPAGDHFPSPPILGGDTEGGTPNPTPTPPVPVTRPDDAPPPRKLTKGFLKQFLSNPPKPRSKRKKSRKERKRGKRRRAPPQAAPAAG